MKTKTLLMVLLSLIVLTAGCVQEKAGETGTAGGDAVQQTTQPTVEPGVEYSLEDSDLGFIEEGDTSEIGEMI